MATLQFLSLRPFCPSLRSRFVLMWQCPKVRNMAPGCHSCIIFWLWAAPPSPPANLGGPPNCFPDASSQTTCLSGGCPQCHSCWDAQWHCSGWDIPEAESARLSRTMTCNRTSSSQCHCFLTKTQLLACAYRECRAWRKSLRQHHTCGRDTSASGCMSFSPENSKGL